jgi:hypothetical protein
VIGVMAMTAFLAPPRRRIGISLALRRRGLTLACFSGPD